MIVQESKKSLLLSIYKSESLTKVVANKIMINIDKIFLRECFFFINKENNNNSMYAKSKNKNKYGLGNENTIIEIKKSFFFILFSFNDRSIKHNPKIQIASLLIPELQKLKPGRKIMNNDILLRNLLFL
jgi:hypothetical protein